MKIFVLSIFLVLISISLLWISGAECTKVVASTSWTAAFAQIAGADSVSIIAPLQLQHPPEYELKPSDLDKVKQADLIVYAGYEKFVEKLVETSDKEKIELLRIKTQNDPLTIKEQAALIAQKIGTVPKYKMRIARFDSLQGDIFEDITSVYQNKKAVVHKFQRPFAEWLGLQIVGEFGPTQPSPKIIAELVAKKPYLVIDNYHNPIGRAIAESAGSAYAQLINFPGKDGTLTIEDVYRYNRQAIINPQIFISAKANADAKLITLIAVIAFSLIIVISAVFAIKSRGQTNGN